VAALAAVGGIALRRVPSGEPGRLVTRPHKALKEITPGDHVLADDAGRRAVLFVPAGYDPTKPAPFFLALHGATGSGDSMLRGSRAAAEAHGVVMLSPSSRDYTWDAIRASYGDDFARIDRMMSDVFDQCAIDPSRVAVGGFSDGATYALSIGLENGDVFTHVVGHSAGFIIPGAAHGKPKVFLSHGRQDNILPIDQCGRRIAAQLRRGGYDLRFDEFDGGHQATPEMRERAMAWFVG
ncbi:MAG: alpha/beta hydrolase, partial [Gemmatimonadaceae bacterium]